MDESPVAGSQYDASERSAEASPAASTTHDVHMLKGSIPSADDAGEAEAEEELQSPNTSTTHGVDMLEGSMPSTDDTGEAEAEEELQSSNPILQVVNGLEDSPVRRGSDHYPCHTVSPV
mgnify:CR=1 FL=1